LSRGEEREGLDVEMIKDGRLGSVKKVACLGREE
jgi:hypothetical protein